MCVIRVASAVNALRVKNLHLICAKVTSRPMLLQCIKCSFKAWPWTTRLRVEQERQVTHQHQCYVLSSSVCVCRDYRIIALWAWHSSQATSPPQITTWHVKVQPWKTWPSTERRLSVNQNNVDFCLHIPSSIFSLSLSLSLFLFLLKTIMDM